MEPVYRRVLHQQIFVDLPRLGDLACLGEFHRALVFGRNLDAGIRTRGRGGSRLRDGDVDGLGPLTFDERCRDLLRTDAVLLGFDDPVAGRETIEGVLALVVRRGGENVRLHLAALGGTYLRADHRLTGFVQHLAAHALAATALRRGPRRHRQHQQDRQDLRRNNSERLHQSMVKGKGKMEKQSTSRSDRRSPRAHQDGACARARRVPCPPARTARRAP